jgi:hypothetical protein
VKEAILSPEEDFYQNFNPATIRTRKKITSYE